MIIEAKLGRPGVVVCNVGFHPRWRYRIDGGEWRQPLQINLSRLGVPAPTGESLIELEFPARLEMSMLGLSLLGWTAALCCLVLTRRTKENREISGASVD